MSDEPQHQEDLEEICASILEAIWDNEFSGTFEPLELIEDLPEGVWLAQSVEHPDGVIIGCLLLTRAGNALLIDHPAGHEWRVLPTTAEVRRAIEEEGVWPGDA